MPRLPIAALAVAASLAIATCGANEDKGDVSDIQPVSADCGEVQYAGSGSASKLIVSDLPLRGDSAERSKQMNDAIVQEIARKGWQAGPDIQLAFQACDDSLASTGEWDEARCRSNARPYASNPDVIGVIGTYNSGCAAVEIPILNQAAGGAIPMVSPGNTFVCLTEPSPLLCKPDEPGSYYPSGKRNYARVVPNDAVQAAGLASFANEAGIRRPYVLYAAGDPTSRGQAFAFVQAAESLGMVPRGSAQWRPEAKDYAVQMRKVRHAGADGLVLAGLLEQHGAQLIRDKVAAFGPNDGQVKLLAFDGFAQQATIDRTGSAAAGMYVSLPGRAPGALTGEGDVFVKELKAQVRDEPIEVFAPYAAEAAEVLVNAIRVGKDRAGAIETLLRTHVDEGITGSFSITPSGDPEPAPISVQRAGDVFELARTITPLPQVVRAARTIGPPMSHAAAR